MGDGGGEIAAPFRQDSPDGAWATSAAREKQLPHLRRTLTGGSPLCFQHPYPGGERTLPDAHSCRGFEGQTAKYLPAGVTMREVERRVGTGWGQGKIGTRLASAPSGGWDTSDGRGLASSRLGSAGSAQFRAVRSLRLQHAGQRPRRHRFIKGSAWGHVGSSRPIDVNVHSWGSGRAPRAGGTPSDWRMRSSPGLRLRARVLCWRGVS